MAPDERDSPTRRRMGPDLIQSVVNPARASPSAHVMHRFRSDGVASLSWPTTTTRSVWQLSGGLLTVRRIRDGHDDEPTLHQSYTSLTAAVSIHVHAGTLATRLSSRFADERHQADIDLTVCANTTLKRARLRHGRGLPRPLWSTRSNGSTPMHRGINTIPRSSAGLNRRKRNCFVSWPFLTTFRPRRACTNPSTSGPSCGLAKASSRRSGCRRLAPHP